MLRRHAIRPGLVLLFLSAAALAPWVVSRAVPSQEEPPGDVIANAMRALLDDLTPALVRYGATALEDEQRYDWNYQIAGRVGLPMFELDEQDRELFWNLLEAALGQGGARQVRDIIAIERHMFETTNDESRDPDWYFLTMFNRPRARGGWGWRFEGHHISINLTLLEGNVVGTTPLFLGTEPTRLSRTTSRPEATPLGHEAAAGRALLEALDADQQRRAVFAAAPPDDIITRADRRAARPSLLGIRYGELNATQQSLMRALIQRYTARLRPDLAASEFKAIEEAGFDEVRFGWAGPVTPGAAHYYRVHGRDFLIEYGHVDGSAEHVHSVWRKFDDDFARRTLREHAATRTAGRTSLREVEAPKADEAPTDVAIAVPAATAPPRTLELVAAEVEANGCDATATVMSRRSLVGTDELPRNVMPDPDLEVLTLSISSSEAREGLENLCQAGSRIDALSPLHPDGSLIGKNITVRLELEGDSRVSVWRATRIRAIAPGQ